LFPVSICLPALKLRVGFFPFYSVMALDVPGPELRLIRGNRGLLVRYFL
jgi:hypothetical protein